VGNLIPAGLRRAWVLADSAVDRLPAISRVKPKAVSALAAGPPASSTPSSRCLLPERHAGAAGPIPGVRGEEHRVVWDAGRCDGGCAG